MYYRITNPDELYHYGVLGMHWGIRRYQNYDGTRLKGGKTVVNRSKMSVKDTIPMGQGGKATGTARLAANAGGAQSEHKSNKMFEQSVKNGKGKDNTSPAEEIAKKTEQTARRSQNLVDVMEKHDPKIKEFEEQKRSEAQKMSDKELRDRINRIKMEKEYVNLAKEDVETGYQKAKEVLDVVGDVAGIAFSVIGIYMMLKKGGIAHEDLDPDVAAFIDSLDEALTHDGLTIYDIDDEYLEHHGVLGMKWGVRRYQNYDGTRIGSKRSSGIKPKDTIPFGQGGKATGTARLAAKAPSISDSTKKSKPYHDRPLTNKDLEISRLTSEEKSDALTYQAYKNEKEEAERLDAVYKNLGLESNDAEILEKEIDNASGVRESINRGKKIYESLAKDEIDILELNSAVYQMRGTYDVDSDASELIFRSDGSTESRPRKRR